MADVNIEAPFGYDVRTHTEVTPKPPPIRWHWHIGPVLPKTYQPVPLIKRGKKRTPATGNEDITVQLTADQQVHLSISGEDRYGNAVPITGDVVWETSDEEIIQIETIDNMNATATAVGPVGTAAVTVTNDADRNGSGDFMGSLAIDVVAGQITEISIAADEPENKPQSRR